MADWARALLPSGLSSAGLLALQAETSTSKTSPSRDASTLSKTPPFSTMSKRIQRSTPAVLQRDRTPINSHQLPPDHRLHKTAR
ncbi:hypothetical protein RB195_018990 [Necator americanus]|uniref:Secreted protein n=1 Tax=Necator americanus TaxID=51031 RepID=A0ABR1CC36_NECAM